MAATFQHFTCLYNRFFLHLMGLFRSWSSRRYRLERHPWSQADLECIHLVCHAGHPGGWLGQGGLCHLGRQRHCRIDVWNIALGDHDDFGGVLLLRALLVLPASLPTPPQSCRSSWVLPWPFLGSRSCRSQCCLPTRWGNGHHLAVCHGTGGRFITAAALSPALTFGNWASSRRDSSLSCF